MTEHTLIVSQVHDLRFTGRCICGASIYRTTLFPTDIESAFEKHVTRVRKQEQRKADWDAIATALDHADDVGSALVEAAVEALARLRGRQ